MGVITVELTKLRMFAAHGWHKEEAVLGNEFEVNVALTISAPEKTIHSIDETVNYVTVYGIVKEEMDNTKPLLETCAQQIAERLHRQFQQVKSVKVNIKKLQPPIAGFVGTVGITYFKEF